MQHSILTSLEPALYPTTTVHGEWIENYFGSRLLRALTEQERQMLKEQAVYFLVFTNRCGSNYLAELVRLMGAGMHPRAELFNSESVLAFSKEREYPTFLDYLLGMVAEHGHLGRVGFKISIQQLLWLTKLGLVEVFQSVRIINCTRQDLLGQAVSYHKAKTTGQWYSEMNPVDGEPVSYSRDELLRSMRHIANARGLLDYYCALHSPPRMDIVYEDLLKNPANEMERIANFLDVADFDSLQVDMGAVEIKQQRNEENENLRREFTAEFSLMFEPDKG